MSEIILLLHQNRSPSRGSLDWIRKYSL